MKDELKNMRNLGFICVGIIAIIFIILLRSTATEGPSNYLTPDYLNAELIFVFGTCMISFIGYGFHRVIETIESVQKTPNITEAEIDKIQQEIEGNSHPAISP